MLRTELYANPHNLFLHDLVLDSCRRHGPKTAIVDTSCGRRITYAEYGQTVEDLARGLEIRARLLEASSHESTSGVIVSL